MDIQMLQAFFMWCTILNGGLLIVAFLVCAYAADWVYRMHSRWYPIPRGTFNIVLYSFIGLFYLPIIIFPSFHQKIQPPICS